MENRENRNREYKDDNRHLFRLGELDDYKVASGDPDVREWTLLDRDNEKLGTIAELIVDRDREKVRYLDVIPVKGIRETEGDHLLIPIGAARIEGDHHNVKVDAIDKDALRSFPAYRGESITRDYEYGIVDRFNDLRGTRTTGTTAGTTASPGTATTGTTAATATGAGTASGFYDNDLYNEDQFYGTRNRRL